VEKIGGHVQKADSNYETAETSQIELQAQVMSDMMVAEAFFVGNKVGLLHNDFTRKRRRRVDRFERYGNATEANASQQSNGLVPRLGHERQPKWIGDPNTIDPRTLGKRRNYTHKIEIEAQLSTRRWVKQFEIKPSNEPNRYAIPANKLDEFNKRIVRIIVKRR